MNQIVWSSFFILLLSAQPALSQSRTITVDAAGSVQVKPDQLKFAVMLIKYGDSTKKAKADFDDLKKSFNTNFNVMKFKGLSKKTLTKMISSQPGFVEGGMAPAMGFGGGGFGGAVPAAPESSQVYVSETIEFTVVGIDKWSEEELEKEVLGYLAELKKLKLTPSSGFSTALGDESSARKKAFAKAMNEARDNASEIAGLSGGTLGKVIKVEQTSGMPDFKNNPYAFAFGVSNMNYGTNGVAPQKTVTANLRVTYELKE